MTSFNTFFMHQHSPVKALVVGDFMLDVYVRGNIERISPEAPVPVIDVQKKSCAPGGAGNVALCLQALGAEVSVLGCVGKERDSRQLRDLLISNGVCIDGLQEVLLWKVPIKKRILAGGQQLFRLDYEEKKLSFPDHHLSAEKVDQLLEGIDVVVISDYDKGFVTSYLLKLLREKAKKRGTPFLVDPRTTDFSIYQGATFIKPNEKEARKIVEMIAPNQTSQILSIEEVGHCLRRKFPGSHIVITRAEKGISLFSAEGNIFHSPAKALQIKDVTGAGDAVLATLAYCHARNVPLHEMIHIANIAAGQVVKKLGCATVSIDELTWEFFHAQLQSKQVHSDLFPLFEKIIQKEKSCFIALDAEIEKNLSTLLTSLFQWKEKYTDHSLILYIQCRKDDVCNTQSQLMHALSSLPSIRWLLVDQTMGYRFEFIPDLLFSVGPEGKIKQWTQREKRQHPLWKASQKNQEPVHA